MTESYAKGVDYLAPPACVMRDNIVHLPTADAERIRCMTARMRDGDQVAFTQFYECYCDRLFRYLLLLTRGDEQFARDLLQATMTKVMQCIREFGDETHLWNWLAASARNNFIDALRRTARAPQIVPLLPEDARELSVAPDEERMLVEALDRCLVELQPDERELLEAFYFEEGSYQSVAEQQNTTAKAVESKLARLRQKLRTALLRQLRYENA